MNVVLRSIIAVAGCALIAACGPVTDKAKPDVSALPDGQSIPALTLSAIQPGTTWVAYEIKKDGISLIPSYCGAEPSLLYFPSSSSAINGVCVFGKQFNDGRARQAQPGEIMGFNPPGSSGLISQGTRFKIEDNNSPEPRLFQLFAVAPGRYFPAFIGFQQGLRALEGDTPYFNVIAGKVNYIGSHNVALGANIIWEPELFKKALLAQEHSFDLNQVNTQAPARGKISCPRPQKSKNLLDINLFQKTGCFLSVLEGPYIR